MATLQSVYIRVSPEQRDAHFRATCEWLRANVGEVRGRYEVRLHPGASWLEVRCPWTARLEALARELARALSAEAVALQLQTTAEVLGVYAFRSAEAVRAVEYTADAGGWLRAEGTPPGWESDAFFSAEPRERDLDCAEDDEDAERIARAYDARTLTVGSPVPSGAGTLAFELARVLELPGFDAPLQYDGSERIERLSIVPLRDRLALGFAVLMTVAIAIGLRTLGEVAYAAVPAVGLGLLVLSWPPPWKRALLRAFYGMLGVWVLAMLLAMLLALVQRAWAALSG